MGDAQKKLELVRQLMAKRGLGAVLVNRVGNFAWLTDGANSYFNTATDFGVASLLVTADKVYLLTNTIEAPRFEAEEPLSDLAPEFRVAPWYEANPAVSELTDGLRLGADSPTAGAEDLTSDFVAMRTNLTPAEGARFAELGIISAEAMKAAIHRVKPGMSEYEIAAVLSQETLARDAWPIVNLIAVDDRIFKVRHPIPSDKQMEKYAMLVLCARRQGLVASVTRLVHFGPLTDELKRKQEACAFVDATFISHTRPGAQLGDIFQAAADAYATQGFVDEWHFHHQGGPASYEPRDFVATPDSDAVAQEGQAFAWNPSIAGVKSEDTILVKSDGNQVLTTIKDWPMLSVTVDGQVWKRPAILEIN
jgi:Xaa-Pro aminopeptidase